jgi:2-haloacid dehalogenase
VTSALLFDVFGTVVDWRSSVIAAGSAVAADVDWPGCADQWRRQGYLEPIGRMVRGEEPWAPIDGVMRAQLDVLADRFGFASVGADALDDLALVWERLDPWPDVQPGLARLKSRYPIGPLSNGSFGGLTRMGRYGGLGWDFIISTELFQSYKPDPKTYLGAAALLGLEPSEVMLVAAHPLDLQAAAGCGLGTAYVPRPQEWGPGGQVAPGRFDVVASDFIDLAARLGITESS